MTSSTTDPAAASSPSADFTDFTDVTDIDGFLRIPRLASVAASDDGRVIAAIQEADEPGAKLVSSLWELDPAGEQPARRLTFST